MTSTRTIRHRLVIVAVNLVVAAVLLEGLFVLLLHAPRLVAASPMPVQQFTQQVYRHFNRSLIQWEPACSQYDPVVAYTLKPGGCTFANVEFTTQVRVNRLGLRDDEAALIAPDVIVLGDSHAMGWGVQQDESLARVLARTSGLKVLNAAISSYATVREMRLLDRLDTSRLKVLIIQYADNDQPENRTFRQRGGQLPIMSEAQYQTIIRHYQAQRSYYPGMYSYRLIMKALRLEAPEPDQQKMEALSPAEEADLFLYALQHGARTPLDHVQVIVLDLNKQEPRRPFLAALDQARRRVGTPAFVQRLITFDAGALLSSQDFYVLDDHMRAHGHAVLGEALAALVGAGPWR